MRYNVRRRDGEYCLNECRNKECPVNMKNAPKGEMVSLKSFCGTVHCKNYIRPGETRRS